MSEILPANAACPRCGGPFRCGATDPHCACFDLQIGPVLRAQLATDYSSCLCLNCLIELQSAQLQQPMPKPTPG